MKRGNYNGIIILIVSLTVLLVASLYVNELIGVNDISGKITASDPDLCFFLDSNGDCATTAIDVVAVKDLSSLKSINCHLELPDSTAITDIGYCKKTLDANGDGVITASDVALIKDKTALKTTTLNGAPDRIELFSVPEYTDGVTPYDITLRVLTKSGQNSVLTGVNVLGERKFTNLDGLVTFTIPGNIKDVSALIHKNQHKSVNYDITFGGCIPQCITPNADNGCGGTCPENVLVNEGSIGLVHVLKSVGINLYAGTDYVKTYVGINSWNNLGNYITQVNAIEQFNGELFSGYNGAYRYDTSSNSWMSAGSFGYVNNLEVYNNQLYGEGSNQVYRLEVISSGRGGTTYNWISTGLSLVNPTLSLDGLITFNNVLYAKDIGGNVYSYDGTSWTTAGQTIMLSNLEVYNNALYVGNSNGQVYRYDGGTTWTLVLSVPTGDSISQLKTHNNKLYLSSNFDADEVRLYSYDGTNLVYINKLTGSQIQILSLESYNLKLYIGTNSGIVYSYWGSL